MLLQQPIHGKAWELDCTTHKGWRYKANTKRQYIKANHEAAVYHYYRLKQICSEQSCSEGDQHFLSAHANAFKWQYLQLIQKLSALTMAILSTPDQVTATPTFINMNKHKQ